MVELKNVVNTETPGAITVSEIWLMLEEYGAEIQLHFSYSVGLID